ncbi:related to 24-dehydrocholesterol reductase precursor [Ramularia collo-cygni]|uniref:Delta(24)-sterol reductase n=1 Tax=Ramularia collo-cygni TaxID=112498 RepID=A0A2D3USS1_9PEZI|nr:related to 24-dehydrocholesterol reductase precursor [Ramularia collo-cygni]CZT14747.1 related to 24-dehydrocholesterol reductase precursor [Ramularia collo-cygni]
MDLPDSKMEAHASKILTIASRIKTFHAANQKFRISHGSTNSTRNQSFRDKQNIIDTSGLTGILEVNPSKKTILVGANVPMDRLVEATLAHNLIPPVVADFPGITVGGGYSGTTGESSSYKHGFFDRTVTRVEMILGTGEIVYLSETENQDLFRGAAGSLGTLGVVTLLEISLVEAKRFVEVVYHPVRSIGEAVAKCKEETSGEKGERNDYVDGILFSPTSGFIITGRRVQDAEKGSPIRRFSGRKDPWFYMHVQSLLSKTSSSPQNQDNGESGGVIKEFFPLPEYLFRYDRGSFWTGRSLFTMTSWLPFNPFTRYLLDDFCKTRMLYAAMHSQPINIMILHDCGVPYPSAENFIEWAGECTGIWPVWLCPLKQSPRPTLHPHLKDGDDGEEEAGILNVGIWGAPRGGGDVGEYLRENEELEGRLKGIGGLKWLYSPQWAEEEEFYKQFNRKWYEDLRTKYSATRLPTIYDKARTDPGELQRKLDGMTWRDVRPAFFPGWMLHCCRKAWVSGQWRAGRKATWMEWVGRGKGE